MPESSDLKSLRHSVQSHAISSQALHEERTIKVCLPAKYDSRRTYPLLICHDGNEFLSYVRVATIANREAESGQIPAMITIFIETARGRRRDDYHPEGSRSHAYAEFVAKECIPALRSLYGQPAQPHQVALCGASLGACANLRILADHPEVARFTLLFSGFYDRPTQTLITQARGLCDISAYMVVGEAERQAKTPSGVFDVLSYN
ncbi:MAG: alpha/beta hydrolase-fold protein, partial [Firmicutes bacterium]|nr:alpha/beta hydrolase-fold protein [Bacillota bacterium]